MDRLRNICGEILEIKGLFRLNLRRRTQLFHLDTANLRSMKLIYVMLTQICRAFNSSNILAKTPPPSLTTERRKTVPPNGVGGDTHHLYCMCLSSCKI
jgi:hypothetical protein